MSQLLTAFEAMIGSLFPPAKVRAMDRGADWEAERTEVERSGFFDALVSEGEGGAGLGFADAVPLWIALGSCAAPLAIGETMIERRVGTAEEQKSARAVLFAAGIAGAAERVLALTVEHANQRVQFGKPVGRQQAVQQQLALMAEQVVAMRLAVELGASGEGWPNSVRAAVAKTVTSAHASMVANTAHGIHGAIGISAEHDLQLFTRRLHAWGLEAGTETLWARELGRSLLDAPDETIPWMRSKLFE